MKIKRFFGADVRGVLQQVREIQGPDAVILSNRRMDGGVEIIAAIDYDEAAFLQLSETTIQNEQAPTRPVTPLLPSSAQGVGGRTRFPSIAWMEDPVMAAVRQELQSVRTLLEDQLSQLTWQEHLRRHPNHMIALRELKSMGVTAETARSLIERLPEEALGEDEARRCVLRLLVRDIPKAQDETAELGGGMMLIGTTGVGKTTTLAKLAARFALRHGPSSVALVSVDNYRIGAHEQLLTFGRLLGIPARQARNANELAQILDALAGVRLILVDTAGVGYRDHRLSEQWALLERFQDRLKPHLVLSAAQHPESSEEAVTAFSEFNWAGVIVTKLDEVAHLGSTLSVLAKYHLPLAYTAAGQRVPEDLERACPENLVIQAAAKARHQCKQELQGGDQPMFTKGWGMSW